MSPQQKYNQSEKGKRVARAATKRWYNKNKNKVKAKRETKAEKQRMTKWRNKNRDRVKVYTEKHRLKIYGLTEEAYKSMLEGQNGVCAICKKKETHKRTNKLSIDHDHKTGKVRGLLCSKHNSLLGYAEDSIKILKETIKYLEERK